MTEITAEHYGDRVAVIRADDSEYRIMVLDLDGARTLLQNLRHAIEIADAVHARRNRAPAAIRQ